MLKVVTYVIHFFSFPRTDFRLWRCFNPSEGNTVCLAGDYSISGLTASGPDILKLVPS